MSLPVIHSDPAINREVLSVTHEQAARMVAHGQARWIRGRRALKLSPHYAMPDNGGRTRTSRGGILAAIGRSQVYTIDDSRGRVSGFKHLDNVDWHLFHQATLDCMA